MSTVSETSDNQFLDLLRHSGPLGVSDLIEMTEVTATAVRQRLVRLMAQGLIERVATRNGRGRPGHRYSLTEKARLQSGNNFSDLALALWQEVRSIKDTEIRRGLMQRIATTLATVYRDRITGTTVGERMESVRKLMEDRRIPFRVDETGGLPVLTALECPYPALADQDRGICAVEKLLFSELLDQDVRLSACRLEGHSCCTFETN